MHHTHMQPTARLLVTTRKSMLQNNTITHSLAKSSNQQPIIPKILPILHAPPLIKQSKTTKKETKPSRHENYVYQTMMDIDQDELVAKPLFPQFLTYVPRDTYESRMPEYMESKYRSYFRFYR